VSVRARVLPTQVSGIALSRSTNVKVIDMVDDPEFNLLAALPECIVFIETARRSGSVFVHCLAGKSRSVAVVCAYLQIVYNLRAEEVLPFLRLRHPPANPNPGFVEQVREWR